LKKKALSMAILSIVLISAMFSTIPIVECKAFFNLLTTTYQIQQEKGKAYVLVAISQDAPGTKTIANEAVSDFKKAGYEVVLIYNATAQNVTDAINDPNTRALWIYGHGKYNRTTKQPIPRINMWGGTFINDTIVGVCPNLNIVTLHSCGQKLDAWKTCFPTAVAADNFRSWKRKAYNWFVLAWQYFGGYSPTIEMPLIDPVLEPQQFYEEEGYYVVNMTGVANDFPLSEPLRSQFGSQRCNFYAVDTTTGEKQVLFGVDIENGRIIHEYYDGAIEPTFDASVTNEALYQILESPSTIWSAYQSGVLEITPYVPVDKDVLFKGIARLFFGQTPGVGGIVIPVDKFGLLAPYIGLASTILVATVATTVYFKRVKRRKEKQ
jgi:hypothetical protein